MNLAGDIFRETRQRQGRTLDDVAAALRVDKRLLADIENNKMPSLPATYIRATLRDYAGELGLVHEEIMDEIKKDPETSQTLGLGATGRRSSVSVSDRVAPSVHSELAKKKKSHQYQIIVVVAIFIFTGLALSIFFFRGEEAPAVVMERPFSEMLNEEQARQMANGHGKDSMVSSGSDRSASTTDSIRLEGVASESVWVRVAADGINITEMVLPPFARKRWVAQREFNISVSVGSAVSFTLNGERVGRLSAARAPMKGILLNRESISKINKPKQ